MRTLLPEGWPRPRGYSNGVEAEGRIVFVAGQFAQTLDNTLAVLREANAGPEHVARMTWYITDKRAYLGALAEIGAIWREKMGPNYPAMAVVEVAALIEDAALIEIETTAVVPL